MPASKHDTYPIKTFKHSNSFENWMGKNHTKADGVWAKIARAGNSIESITHAEALNVALCYGWIDGLRRSLDESYFVQKFTPRRPNSIWSAINKQKVAALIKEGRMKQAGLDAIATAKKNGRWKSAYASQSSIAIPADLQQELDKHPKAKPFFPKLTSQNRYAILFRISQLKKSETRVKKILKFVAMLEREETIHPQK